MTHTPLPWFVSGNEIVGAEGTPEAWVVAKMAYGHSSSAPVFSYLDLDQKDAVDLTKANSALIVTAVNSHATLMSALESLLGACLVEITGGGQSCEVCGRYDPFAFDHEAHEPSMPCGRAAAAISAAKGESK